MTAPLSQSDDNEISLLDTALVIAENIPLLIIAPLIVGLVALGVSFRITPTYTASTRILAPQQQQSSGALLANQFGALTALAGIRNPADTYVAMIKSRTVADELVEQFKLRELTGVEFKEDARNALSGRTRVGADKDGVITIEVDDHEPASAAAIANAYVEHLRTFMQKLAITEAAQRRVFFEKQLAQARDDLTKAEITLRTSGIGEAALKTTPQSAIESLARLKAQVTAQEVRVASMRGAMTIAHPEFQQAARELSALRDQLVKAEQNDTGKASGSGAEYIARFRDFKYRETLFELMARQYETARLDEAREGAVIQIIDPAIPPERKSKPKKAQIAIVATLITAVLTLLFVFIRHALRSASANSDIALKLKRIGSAILRRKA